MRLYQDVVSGNCYKVRLTAHLVGQLLEIVDMDVIKAETRTPAFLAKNPNGRVPLLELDDGRFLAESNAIICYLAEGSALLPTERFVRAQVLQWLFFEQYSHEPFIAVARFWWSLAPGGREAKKDRFEEWWQRGRDALGVMETHLEGRNFFVGEVCTLADIALYAYTHVADEGGFDLSAYPRVLAWLDRVAAEPGHIAMR